MAPEDFKNLRYGNTIQTPDGKNWGVSLVIRDPQNKAKRVFVVPVIELSEAERITLISKDRAVSFITGQTINAEE